jgi:hypothetical protein
MSYRVAVVSTLAALVLCSAGLVSAMHPLTALFPLSGATDVAIIMPGWNAWQISYYTTADVSAQLEERGWSSADDRQYGPLGRAYTRILSFGVGEVREWAFEWRDPAEPQIANVRERGWIELPWWQSLRSTLAVQ